MSYFDLWNSRIESGNDRELSEYAKQYYQLETLAYQAILAAYPDAKWEGTAVDLATKLGFEGQMDIFLGFLEGINSSLETEIDLPAVEDATELKLDIDFKKLYWNMRDASAKWLYELEEWDNVLPVEERKQLTKDFNREHIAVSNKVGRNDPCPCGSGKKYKQCCSKKS